MIGPRPMTTIIRLNAIAARRIAEKFSPAKIGSARNCKSVMLDISHRISRVRLRPGETLASQRNNPWFRRASPYRHYSASKNFFSDAGAGAQLHKLRRDGRFKL